MPLFRLLFACLPFCSLAAHSAPLSSRFTYQGVLEQSGTPATGEFDLRFEPFGSAAGGAPLAPALTLDNVPVQDGLFRAELDLGPGFFVGDEVFLSIGVRAGTSTGSFTTLAPRQAVTATPYALTALGLADSGTGQGSLLGRRGFTARQIDINADSPSMIVGTDGFPIISFFDPVAGDLRVLHCEDATCLKSTAATIDATGIVGEFSSIAILRTGLPAISYYDRTNGDLKLAYCHTISCSSSSVHTVDSTGDVGQYTALVGGDASAPAMIFYYDVTQGDLKWAGCNASECNLPRFVTVDQTGDTGRFVQAVVGEAGDVMFAYYRVDTAAVKLGWCSIAGCFQALVGFFAPVNVETNVIGVDSIGLALGPDGLPSVGYKHGTSVRIAVCESLRFCSNPQVATVVNLNAATAMSTAIDGMVWIGGRGYDSAPAIGRCKSQDACGSARTTELTRDASTTSSAVSLARAADGAMMLAAGYGNSLRIFHCGSTQTCVDAGVPR